MIALVNPNLVVQRNDPFTTGIVYMPIGLAYAAAALRSAGLPVTLIDSFALGTHRARRLDPFLLVGLDDQEVVSSVSDNTEIVFVYANQLANHISTLGIIRALKKVRPAMPLVVLENSQAVTAYALHPVAQEFYTAGADYILTGNVHNEIVRFVRAWRDEAGRKDLHRIPGLGAREFYNPPDPGSDRPDDMPFPAWDLFPLENYWGLRFAHGPQTEERYLPILTSRGCPYACTFCVAPATNSRRWCPRSAENVVDEMAFFAKTYRVREYHWEDLNPTVSDPRIRDICHEILARRLQITWKIAAGTKVETILNEETVDLMANAGCRYISISPETGSADLLEKMNKPFNPGHAAKLIKKMNEVGIRSQACFVLGFPGETRRDLQLTRQMISGLTKAGVDEIALFIITPVPGSGLCEAFSGYQSLSELNFSPSWRPDFRKLNRFRVATYGLFLVWKIWYHPLKILRQIFNFITRRFETKMEMVPYRALVLKRLDVRAGFAVSP